MNRLFLLLAILALPACSPSSIFFAAGLDAKPLDVAAALKKPPDFAAAPIILQNLGQSEGLSFHLAWVKTREEPHIHASHDATVLLIKGRGSLLLNGKNFALQTGDLVSVPRGAVHAFSNQSAEPAVAYVIFSPPFDGKDSVPVSP